MSYKKGDFMVIEFVYGNLLEKRLSQLITARKGKKKLKIFSQHVHEASINDVKFSKKLEQLVKSKTQVIIVINRRVLARDKKEQEFVQELDEIGVRVYPKKFIHAKLVLLEGKSEGLLVSSLNITDTAIHQNKEAGIFIEDDEKNLITEAKSYISTILGNT